VTVTAPPRRPEAERDRELEQRIADLEALIEEARRRARRRRQRNGAAALLVIAAGGAAFIGFGGHGGGEGTAGLTHAPGSQSPTANAGSPPLSNLPAGIGISAFAFDPRRPDTVYAAAMGATADARKGRGYVYKTVDGGQHWHPTATTGAGWTRADTLAADPLRPGTLYAGNTVAVYKTVDGGRSWRPFNRGLFPGPREISRTPGSPNYHFGTPGTTTWNRDEGWITDIAVDPADNNIVYSASGAVRKSTNGGHTWKTAFRPKAAGVARIAIASTRPQRIYVMTGDANGSMSIYKSTDAGTTWHATHGRGGVFRNTEGWGYALAVDPHRPTTVYAAIGHTIVKTTNAGASWQPIMHSPPEQHIMSLAVDPQQRGTVYAGVHTTRYTGGVYETTGGGIYKTTDGGRTWQLAVSTIAIDEVSVNPARPTTIYAAGSAGPDARYWKTSRLLRSTDRGRSWTIAR
jgi:photosystem II stability/assembly factor-like uncharacterized protein